MAKQSSVKLKQLKIIPVNSIEEVCDILDKHNIRLLLDPCANFDFDQYKLMIGNIKDLEMFREFEVLFEPVMNYFKEINVITNIKDQFGKY